MTQRVHLGYEIGTGEPVEIPMRHMVVTGQTQEAGKTTALEAMISRSGMKAIAFVTMHAENPDGNAFENHLLNASNVLADEACKKLLAMGFLTREENGFKAVAGMKVNIVGR